MATDTQNPPAGPVTYTMRGTEYPFEPPADGDAISRLIWLANNGRGDWLSAAVRCLKAARDESRIITFPGGEQWKVEGIKKAEATPPIWTATRLTTPVDTPITDVDLVAHVRAGTVLNAAEVEYLLAVINGRWHELPLRGSQTTPRQVRANRWQPSGYDRLYIELRISSTSPRSGRVGYLDLKTGKPVADDSQADLAEAVAALLAGSQLCIEDDVTREAADIRRVQALVLRHRAALEAEIGRLDAEIQDYSIRSKSHIKAAKKNRWGRITYALEHAQADPELLTEPQIKTLYAVARELEN